MKLAEKEGAIQNTNKKTLYEQNAWVEITHKL